MQILRLLFKTYRRHITHIIAQSLAGVKIQKLRSDQNVVKPQWIVDCLKEECLLPIKPYILAAQDKSESQVVISDLLKCQPQLSGECLAS